MKHTDDINGLIKWLDEEVEKHREKENTEPTTWGRGFENGAMTECILLKQKIRQLISK